VEFNNLPEAHVRVQAEAIFAVTMGIKVKEHHGIAINLRDYVRDVMLPMLNDHRTATIVTECEGLITDLRAAAMDLNGISKRWSTVDELMEEYRL
jgi:hypothetical protein